jgi:type II secretory pathway pseudopilin PulG
MPFAPHIASSSNRRDRRRGGFTLIELLLALGLSVTLLLLLSRVLGICLNLATDGRAEVERARLAAGIFEILSSDLRAIRTYDPQDTSQATAVAEEMAAFDVDSLDSIGASGSSAGSTTGSSTGSSSAASGTTSSTPPQDSSLIEQRRPLGVYGTLTQLQIDVASVPPDWQAMVLLADPTANTTTLPDPPCRSMATVTYGLLTNGGLSGGLARTEVSRDQLSFGEINGSIQPLEPVVIAPEVSQIEFRYFDGTQLLETWDMELMEGTLPKAIQIVVWLSINQPDATSTTPPVAGNMQSTLQYSITVPLRGLENGVNDQQEAAAAESAAATTSGSATTQ